MHKFRTALSVVATAAMVLGTMGVAAAAGTTSASSETRGAYIMQLDESLGISPVNASTPTFTDVSASNPYYGYIEAAYQKGFVNGFSATTFGPNDPLTRAQAAKILVEAYEGGNYTPTATSTTFTDNSSIPTALVGFVAEAKTLGLLNGFLNGSFGPNSFLSTAQNTHLIAQLKSALASAAFKVTASSNDVGVGQIVTLSSTATGSVTYTVTGANASSALVSGSSFVASASGNYTVNGTTASGVTASTKISVYGSESALKITAPTIVANGASSNTITVDVLDANGNVVANSNDEIILSGLGSVLTGGTDVYAVNGVATFTLTSGSVPGAVSTLSATDNTNGSVTAGTLSVTSVAQQATSISVSAPAYLSANAANSTETYKAEVDDQTGNPMLYGTWGLTATITGPASTDNAGTMTQTAAYSNGTDATFNLYDVQGVTGAISITVAGSGLTSGTATTTAVIAGTPVALQVSQNAGSSVSADSEVTASFASLTVTAVDSHGYPADWNGTADVTVTSGGSASTEFGTITVPAFSNASSQSVNLTGAGDAGTYTFAVSDAAASLTGNSTTLTVTPGAAAALSASAPKYVSIASPTATVSAQLVDAEGNAVSQSGVTVDFAITTGSNGTLTTTSAATNAQGVATDTLTLPYATGTVFDVQATSVGLTASTTAGTQVEGTIASNVQLSVVGVSQVTAGNTVQFDVYANDQYNNPVASPDTVNLSFNHSVGTVDVGGSPVIANSDGSYTFTVPASGYADVTAVSEGAGPLTATVQDTSSASQPSGTISFVVTPGTFAGYQFVDASGNIYGSATQSTGAVMANISDNANFSFSANVPAEIWVQAVDVYGNPVVVSTNTPVNLGTTGVWVGGYFRSTSSGSDVTTATISAGTTETAVWYVNSTGQSNQANFFDGAAK